jgi:hypothetical protein
MNLFSAEENERMLHHLQCAPRHPTDTPCKPNVIPLRSKQYVYTKLKLEHHKWLQVGSDRVFTQLARLNTNKLNLINTLTVDKPLFPEHTKHKQHPYSDNPFHLKPQVNHIQSDTSQTSTFKPDNANSKSPKDTKLKTPKKQTFASQVPYAGFDPQVIIINI